jgi:NTE family protein
MPDEKVGLVLAGGGAKGSYQAKVAQKLLKKKKVDVITGISAGALNGSMLSQGKEDELAELWKGIRREDVWAGGHGPWRYFKLLVGWALGIYDPEPLYDIIQRRFDPNDVNVTFKAGAVSLKSGEYVPYEIRPEKEYAADEVEKAQRFVVASSAVPIGVEPVNVGGELMVDGGTRNVAPVGDAIDENVDRIIAIFNSRLDNKFDKPEETPSHAFGIGEWAFDIFLNELIRSDVEMARAVNSFQENIQADIDHYDHIPIDVIEPSRPIGTATDFSEEAWKN